MNRKFLTLSVILVFAAVQAAFADGLTARLNSDRVVQGDPVTLTLSTQSGGQVPDLAPLEADFDILGQSSGRQTSIVNGVRSDTQSWTITLMPRQAGEVTIPALTAGSQSSAPLTLTVLDAAQLPPAIRASRPEIAVTPPEGGIHTYQEVPLTITMRLPAGTRGADVTAPTGDGYSLEQSGEDQVQQLGNGVVEVTRTYLLRPAREGALEIGPFSLRAEIADPNARDPFADFDRMFANMGGFGGFQRPSFGSMFTPTNFVRAISAPVTLDVKPTPAGQSGWALPAKTVEIRGIWEPESPEFKVGEAVTRKVQVYALGATGEQIPDITLPQVDGAQVYFNTSDTQSVPFEGGTASMREFSWSVVPTSGGTLTLPEISVEWFDTSEELVKLATLASESFEVEGPVIATATPTPPIQSAASGDLDASDPSLRWIILIFAGSVVGIAIAGSAYWLWRRDPAAPQQGQARESTGVTRRQAALAQAKQSLAARDASMMHRAVLDWVRAAGLHRVRIRAQHPELDAALQELDQSLYASSGSNPDLAKVMAALRDAERNLSKSGDRKPILPPLYPDLRAKPAI